MDRKIKHFTHNDWDGVACAGITHLSHSIMIGKDIEFLNYNNIYDRLTKFFSTNECGDYDKIYITDLSLNKEQKGREQLATHINNLNILFNNILWFDHHKTSDWMENFDWMTLDYKNIECGTSLYYKYHKDKDNIKTHLDIERYVEMVTQYDTYNFKKTRNPEPLTYNYYFKLLGCEDYYKELKYKTLFMGGELLDSYMYKMGKAYLKRSEEKIDSMLKDVIFIKELNCGIIYNKDYDLTSLLGNTMCEKFDIDFAMIFYNGGVALRSIGDRFDCSVYAKLFGGGGHVNSAGFRTNINIEQECIEKWIKTLK